MRSIDKEMIPNQILQLINDIDKLRFNYLIGMYWYGLAVLGRLHPDSELDIMIVISDGMVDGVRNQLTKSLLNLSGSIGNIEKIALELTVVKLEDIDPLIFPA